jgi:arylsulfatase A-like enzyme
VVSDHGENFHDHDDTFDHGHTVYESTVHAVCMIRPPASRGIGDARGRAARGTGRGVLVDSPVSVVDLLPTVLDRLGIEAPPRVEGRVLDLDVRESAPRDRLRFAEATKPWQDVEREGRWHNLYKARCVRSGPWKLVQIPYLSREELYRLDRDPGERTDLLRGLAADAAPDPERDAILGRLRTELEVWAGSAVPLPSVPEGGGLGDTEERLRNLGYLDPRERVGK